MYQAKIIIILLVIIVIMMATGLHFSRQQLDLMMQGKNKPRRMSFDRYNDILRKHFPRARELYEVMIIDVIGYNGLISLINANILVLKHEADNGYSIYDFYY